MQKAIRKTDKELAPQKEYRAIKVKDYKPIYGEVCWHCDICNIMYEPNDIVLLEVLGNDASLLCPRKKRNKLLLAKIWVLKNIFKKDVGVTCGNNLHYGTKEYFKTNYHISDM